MSEDGNYQLPVWAPRLRKIQIERLYQSCGRGLLDEELIDEVGFSLYSRCKSMLQVSQSIRGNPPCPRCGSPAQLDRAPDPFARCANCGWLCPWALYQKTYQHKGLFAGGLEPFIDDFVRKFPATRAYRERMVLIDTLIHRFHWESTGNPDGRPGATSLIEGKMKDIMPFLDRLSYGDNIPPEIARTREEWRKKWRQNAWSSGKGQGS
jgi:ribosomal protein L37AE/L43A